MSTSALKTLAKTRGTSVVRLKAQSKRILKPKFQGMKTDRIPGAKSLNFNAQNIGAKGRNMRVKNSDDILFKSDAKTVERKQFLANRKKSGR